MLVVNATQDQTISVTIKAPGNDSNPDGRVVDTLTLAPGIDRIVRPSVSSRRYQVFGEAQPAGVGAVRPAEARATVTFDLVSVNRAGRPAYVLQAKGS